MIFYALYKIEEHFFLLFSLFWLLFRGGFGPFSLKTELLDVAIYKKGGIILI